VCYSAAAQNLSKQRENTAKSGGVQMMTSRERWLPDGALHTTGLGLACVIVTSFVLAACVSGPPADALRGLNDLIEREADSLRLSAKSNATIAHRIEPNASWVVMFVPRNGFNEGAAARAEVPKKLRREVTSRAQAWRGSAFIVFATAGQTTIARLGNNIDVAEQIVQRGEPGGVELTVGLDRVGEAVSVSSVTSRPL
jgi:hypothetical protein